MAVLDSNTGIVPSTERKIALNLDRVQHLCPSIKVEDVINASLFVRFSTQYDNCLIIQSGDKWPCSRWKVRVDVVRVDFLPYLGILLLNVYSQTLDGLDRYITFTDAANNIDSTVNEEARRTTSGNVELRHLIPIPLVSCNIVPVTSLLLVTVSISTDQEYMPLVLNFWVLRASGCYCILLHALSIILAKTKGWVASSKAGIASDGLWVKLALIKFCQFDALSIFFLH